MTRCERASVRRLSFCGLTCRTVRVSSEEHTEPWPALKQATGCPHVAPILPLTYVCIGPMIARARGRVEHIDAHGHTLDQCHVLITCASDAGSWTQTPVPSLSEAAHPAPRTTGRRGRHRPHTPPPVAEGAYSAARWRCYRPAPESDFYVKEKCALVQRVGSGMAGSRRHFLGLNIGPVSGHRMWTTNASRHRA